MKFTLDTQLGALLDHPQAKPIIEKYLPGISTNPMVGLVKGNDAKCFISYTTSSPIWHH
jgi:hypothetical protein